MSYPVIQVDKSNRTEVFKSCFKSGIIGGILFSFIAWLLLGVFGGNITYFDSEKNRLKNLGYRLGIGVSFGFHFGTLLCIVLLITGIKETNIVQIIIVFILFPSFISIGVFCIRKYKKTLPTIINTAL